MGHGDPLANPQYHIEHTVSANNSSSSSSNNAPSEPTIDHSSWSPRSLRIESLNSAKWTPKPNNFQRNLAGNCSENALISLPHHTTLLTSIGFSLANQATCSQKSPPIATEDPTRLRDSQWNTLISAILQSFPHPIKLNPIPSLTANTPEHSTFRAAQRDSPGLLPHLSTFPHPTPSLTIALATAFMTPFQIVQRAVLQFLATTLSGLEGPVWPKAIYSPRLAQTHTQALSELQHPLLSSKPLSVLPTKQISSSPQASGEPPRPVAGLALLSDSAEDGAGTPIELTQPVPAPTPPNTNPPSSHQTSNTRQKNKRGKERMSPTRRSPRLQAKKRVGKNSLRRSPSSGNQTKGIVFSLGDTDTPIAMDTTLQILEATGLQINKQIEDLVQEAVQKDQAKDQADKPDQTPTTPLHDLIPPMDVPGCDLQL